MNFLIFGDSITWGAWDREGGWAERLKKCIHTKVIDSNVEIYHSVYTLGIPGDTTKTLLERFEQEISHRIEPSEENVIIFAIGINDSQVELSTGKNEVTEKEFEQNVQQLFQQAKKYSTNIFTIGLTPIDESKVNPMEWQETHGYQTAQVEKYNDLLRKISAEYNVGFIELINKFPESYKNLLVDGVHPNDEGHTLIYEVVKRCILFQNI